MIDLSFINNPDFMNVVFYVFAFGFVSWFMGWGVTYVTSLFIKILQKGV